MSGFAVRRLAVTAVNLGPQVFDDGATVHSSNADKARSSNEWIRIYTVTGVIAESYFSDQS
jgi:hypothetical protein